jgi:microcystin-dependent protein
MPSVVSNLGPPVGTIQAFGGNTLPAGWLLCDGSSLPQSTYASLFKAIGTAFGVSGSNFNIPDLRGQFLRGVSSISTNDPNKTTRTAMVPGTFTLGSCATVLASPTITVPSTANLAVGMTVAGAGVLPGSVIVSIPSSITFQTALGSGATATVTLTFSNSATGNAVGSVQSNATAKNGLALTDPGHFHINTGIGGQGGAPGVNSVAQNVSGNGPYNGQSATTGITLSTGDAETRPLNAYVNFLIKAY